MRYEVMPEIMVVMGREKAEKLRATDNKGQTFILLVDVSEGNT